MRVVEIIVWSLIWGGAGLWLLYHLLDTGVNYGPRLPNPKRPKGWKGVPNTTPSSLSSPAGTPRACKRP
jgi:hypothetical protein